MVIITMKSIQQNIINSLTNDTELVGKAWKRLPDLNKILKGFREGELTVLSGKTGTGKTTFMSEYSLDLAENSDVRTLWGSFEVSITKLSKIMLTQFAGKSLKKDEEAISYYIEKFNRIPMFFIQTQGRENFKGIFQEMRAAYKEHRIDHIILDNLQFMVGQVGSTSNDKFHAQDQFVGQLRNFVNETNIHLTLIAHPRKENGKEELTSDSLYGGCKLAQESDNILLLQTIESQNRKYIQVVKNRHDGGIGSMTLKFKPDSLTFGVVSSKPKDGAKKASQISRTTEHSNLNVSKIADSDISFNIQKAFG